MLFGGAPPAVADPGEPSLTALYNLVQTDVDRSTADVVVLIDVSASMNAVRYDRVKQSLTDFFARMAPVDQVTLIPFADSPAPFTQRVGKSPGKLVDALPERPAGGRADLGAALDSAITTLERPKAPGLATVVLLSGSPNSGAGNWAGLRERTRKLRQHVDAYAIPLAGVTGAPMLTKVWPKATVMSPTSVYGLTAALAQPREVARATKARNLLSWDLGKPIRVNWPLTGGISHGTSVTRVEVKSTLKYVPLTLERLAISGDNPAVTLSVPAGPITLAPGETVIVPVTAQWDAGPRRRRPLWTVSGKDSLELSGQVSSPWAGCSPTSSTSA
ncbi:vWA domain-containing protein [Paractinoplanes durhamensis]|uniref:vWA domain-containing protein n=1 Tax=Paractinoplanes durhamensis TaxID=113563 RepID=UPI003636EC31